MISVPSNDCCYVIKGAEVLGVSVVRGTTLMIRGKLGPHYSALLSERTITTRSDAVRSYSYTGDWRIFAKFEHFFENSTRLVQLS